jgi:alkylhydroperoxidase family enzyme
MAVTLSACTTPLSKEAASIVTVRSDSAGSIVHDCRRLGTVEGGSSTVFGGAVGYNQATAEIKERAAAMGADTVVLTHHAENFSGTALTAVAYHCAKQ